MSAPVKVTINAPITIGKITIEPGTKISVNFSSDGKSVYIPNGKGGFVAKPAYFVTRVALPGTTQDAVK